MSTTSSWPDDRRLAWTLRAALIVEATAWLVFAQHQLAAGQGMARTLCSVLALALGWRLCFVALSFAVKPLFAADRQLQRGVGPWLLAYLRECWAMLRFYTHDQLWARSGGPDARQASQATPVLLAHGFLCNGGVFVPLLARLPTALAPYSVALEPSYRDFEHNLARLESALDRLLAAHPGERVLLVGHSMGGLLVRALAERRPEAMAGVLILAAPHHGTWFGNLVYGSEAGPPSARSRWLQAWNARAEPAAALPWLNAWTPQDNIVIPAASSRWDKLAEQCCEGQGHLSLLSDPAMLAAWVDWLMKAAKRAKEQRDGH